MWEKPGIPALERKDDRVKNEINKQLETLLKSGTNLADIVDLLDAKDFFSHVRKGRSEPVAFFDVEGFIKKRTGENRKFSLPEEYKKIDEVILPPSEKESRFGSGTGYKEKGMIPRSTLLMETLTEMGLKYSIIEGTNDSKMMRKLSYLIFEIPSIKKLVLVNDEEGNASFVIHKLEQEEWKDYAKKTKAEFSSLPPDLVSIVIYPDKNNKEGHQEQWKERMNNLLINGPKQPKDQKDIKEIEEIPKDWVVLSALMRRLDASWPVLQGYVDEYKKIRPELIKHRGLAGTYVSPELVDILKKNRLEKVLPEGWLSPFALAKKLNLTVSLVQSQGKKYRQVHPEWFKFYTNIQGKEIEHYSPELIRAVSEKCADFVLAPDNWITRNALSKMIGMNEITMKKIAEEYRMAHPEYFKYYKAKIGVPSEYYSPELKKIFIDKYGIGSGPQKEHYSHKLAEIQLNKEGKIELVPEDWSTVSEIRRLVNAGIPLVKEVYEKYKTSHPEWFGIYKNSKGFVREYYHPELVGIIKKEFDKEKAMPGWLVSHALAKAIDVDGATVKKRAEIYRISNPEWFKIFKDKKGIPREHYSPELIIILKKELQALSGSFEKAPDGWMTKSALMKYLKVDWFTREDIINSYKISHPDYFKIYEDEKGTPREHCSPQLLKIVKEVRKKDEAPDNWKTAAPLAKSLGVAIDTLQNYAGKYRSQHPGWFKEYRHKRVGRYMEYYSPELVEILEEVPKLKK